MSEEIIILYFLIIILVCSIIIMNSRHIEEMKGLQDKLIEVRQFGDMPRVI